MLEQKGLCTAEEWQRHHLQKDKPAGLGVVHYPQPIHQQGPLETSKVRTDYNNIQLFPEGEVNSGGYIPRRIYPLPFTDPEGDSCFSIYQIRWIKKMPLH